jgi:hypothetical protein
VINAFLGEQTLRRLLQEQSSKSISAPRRNTGTAVFEDGVFGNDPLASTLNVIEPVENSVEEVKLLTGTLPAEYGHSTSGVISTVKKSGSNEFHGLASDYTEQPQPGNPHGVPAWFMQPDASAN